jgi:type IV secretory pathway ATPase VirB11/archaellum biosynthesis ATPase
MSNNKNTSKYTIIPLVMANADDLDQTPCQMNVTSDTVNNKNIRNLRISCGNCQKSECGLSEYLCATNIANRLVEETDYSTIMISGRNTNRIYDHAQMEKIYGLSRIYKRSSNLVPTYNEESNSCKRCHSYLRNLFATLRLMVFTDPSALYKNREFYLLYAKTLCPECGVPLKDFVNEFTEGFEYIDIEWCRKVEMSNNLNIDLYSPMVEIKNTKKGTVLEKTDMETITERKVGGHDIKIGHHTFNIGNSSDNKLNELIPISDTRFTRRQKIYSIESNLSESLTSIIYTLRQHILTDTEVTRMMQHTTNSLTLRNLVKQQINEKLNVVMESLGIDNNLTNDELDTIEHRVLQYTVGWGTWEIFMIDDQINEFSAIQGCPAYIETYADGKCRTNLIPSQEDYERFLRLLQLNVNCDFFNRVLEAVVDPEKHPIGFGRMRLTLFQKPLVDGNTFIVRKHRKMQLSGGEIIIYGTASPAMLAFLSMIKRRNKSNIVYVGDVGSGKTTVQYIVDTKIPIDSTVITIGDIVELDLSDMGFNNTTLYADRPGEEVIGQSRDSLIAKALRMKSDQDLITEVLSPRDTASWVQTWVAGKTGSVTYHAYNVNMMLIRCGDELRATGTMNPETKMTIFQSVVECRRTLSYDGYKYRIASIKWTTDEVVNNYPKLESIFTWDNKTDKHIFNKEIFEEVQKTNKFQNVFYSLDSVKEEDMYKELLVYEILWTTFAKTINIYNEIGMKEHLVNGNINNFKNEIDTFVDIFDTQNDMYRSNGKTDWELLCNLGKRKIYDTLISNVKEFEPDVIEKAYALIHRNENDVYKDYVFDMG